MHHQIKEGEVQTDDEEKRGMEKNLDHPYIEYYHWYALITVIIIIHHEQEFQFHIIVHNLSDALVYTTYN